MAPGIATLELGSPELLVEVEGLAHVTAEDGSPL